MNSPLGAPAVLIVDEDIAFVWWLGEIFHDLGCRVVPALSCVEALLLAETANLNADVIVLNPALRGADAMLHALGRVRSPKIVAIHDTIGGDRVDPAAHAVLERPSAGEPITRVHWIWMLRGILAEVGARAAS